MKTFLLMCVILVARIQAEFLSPIPAQYDQIVDACRAETGYTDEVVAKEEESYFAENKGLRIFYYCFLEKTGFVTSDGEIHIDDALAKFSPGPLKNIMERCNSLEKTYPKTIFLKCTHVEITSGMRVSKINSYYASPDKLPLVIELCRNETGYTDEAIAEEEKSNLETDAGLRKFNNCFLEKTGFRNDEKFNIDEAIANSSQSFVTSLVELCKSGITEKAIPNTVPVLSACLHLGLSYQIRDKRAKVIVHNETDQVLNIVHDCQEENGFGDTVLQNGFTEENITDEQSLKKFNDCFLEKAGFVSSDGNLNIDAALDKLPPSFAKPIVEHCQAKIILNYTTESVPDFSTCYLDETLNHITMTKKVGYWPFTGAQVLFVPGDSFVDTILTF